jgi:glycerophosphoryl diester phosphodiesterase
VNKKVSSQTLAELRALDVGRWKGKQWSDQRIPTLEEVLAIVPDGRRLFVEVKCGPDGIPEFARVAGASLRRPSPMVAIGFSRQTMKQLKAQMLELEVYWIIRARRSWKTGRRFPAADEMIAAAREAGLDGVDLDAGGPVNAGLVKHLKAARLKVYVWTVDSVARARRLVAANVDGITTNRPQWLRQKLAH